MRYLRVFKKSDFDKAISTDQKYLDLMSEMAKLAEEEKGCRRGLSSAGAKSKEYSALTNSLQKHDGKLALAQGRYQQLLVRRKEIVDEVRTRKKELFDDSKVEIAEFSRRSLYLQRKMAELDKSIANYKNKKYSEICDDITKRKISKHREDNQGT